MKVSDAFEVGYIARTHGLKGGVIININQQFELPLVRGIALFVQQGSILIPYFIKEASVKGDKAYVTFDDVVSVEQAKPLTKHPVYLPREARPKLRGAEFYDDEVEGFTVLLGTQVLGQVAEVVWSGTQRMLEVKGTVKDLLIPINTTFIVTVNRVTRTIHVELPEGFLDL